MIKKYLGKFNAVSLSHELIKANIQPGQFWVDATCGNGYDTVFLAEAVTARGHVFAFDVQTAACEATEARAKQAGFKHISIFNDSHENTAKYTMDQIDGAVFNLGYLPGAARKITTKPKSTKKAVKSIMGLLKCTGFICITAYVSHPGGRREYRTILRMLCRKGMSGYQTTVFDEKPEKNPSPKVLFLEKQVDF